MANGDVLNGADHAARRARNRAENLVPIDIDIERNRLIGIGFNVDERLSGLLIDMRAVEPRTARGPGHTRNMLDQHINRQADSLDLAAQRFWLDWRLPFF